MMSKNCWDCIHCDVCANIDGFSHHVSDVSKCKHFNGKADVEPVKREKWEVVRTHNNFIKHMYKCLACEKNQFARSNYCPNCGAKMDGKEVQE